MWKKIPLKAAVYSAVGINIAVALLIIATRGFLPPVVPLFYGLPYGESQLVPNLILLLIPAGSLILSLVNLIIALYIKDIFFKKTLIIGGTFISVLGALTVIKIIFLVGFF